MKYFLSIIAIVCAFTTHAQQLFPTLTCETLADKTLIIPNDVKGKRSVICLAMSPKAEKMLREWNNPLYNALMADGMGGLMGGKMYDANLCFIGMLKGVAKIGLNEAKKQSKKEIDKKQYGNFMVSENNVNELTTQLNINATNEPHFFVLDAAGAIIYHTQGSYTDAKINSITDKLLQ